MICKMKKKVLIQFLIAVNIWINEVQKSFPIRKILPWKTWQLERRKYSFSFILRKVCSLTIVNRIRLSLTAPIYPIVAGMIRQVATTSITRPPSITTWLVSKLSRLPKVDLLNSNFVELSWTISEPVFFGRKVERSPNKKTSVLGT